MKVETENVWAVVVPYDGGGRRSGETHFIDRDTLCYSRSQAITEGLTEWCLPCNGRPHDVGTPKRRACWRLLRREGYRALRVRIAQVKR